MAGATDERVAALRRRLDGIAKELDSARAAARARDNERFTELVRELNLAERRLLEELVDDRANYPDAFEMVLADWDAYLDRLKRRVGAARA